MSDISFGIGYHKDQGICAPFKKSGAAFAASVLCSQMQKDLSDWINTSKIQIDDKTVKEISKSFSEE